MKTIKSTILLALLMAVLALPGSPQTGPQVSADFSKRVEAYMRELFAWGPNITLKLSPPRASAMPGLLQVDLEVSLGGQTNTGSIFASPDGKFIVRGELHDTSTDPFAANRAKITTENFPSRGPANAKITVVEFADFQCPSCKEMHAVLAQIMPNYPQVRFVFKDLPLVQIHPWAMTAALAGRCAYQQKPQAFWAIHDDFFENQGLIGAADAWGKSLEFAAKAGLDEATMRSCMAAPETKAIIEGSLAEARALSIGNTPTTFINGRRVIGPDGELFEQYLKYELAKFQPASPARPAKQN